MVPLLIPLWVVYVGLGGLLLALVVATAQQRWSPRVFFLLALRLAIGWHFLFEGLQKIHSHYVGPTETSRPFSGEPYFRTAPGPLGEYMRRQYYDAETVIAERVRPAGTIDPQTMAGWSQEEQAAACPPVVARELDGLLEKLEEAIRTQAEAELARIPVEEQRELAAANNEAARLQAVATTVAGGLLVPILTAKEQATRQAITRKWEAARAEAQRQRDNYGTLARQRLTAAKAAYARWVHGVEPRPTTVRFISGDDVPRTAPQRLAYLDELRRQLQEAEDRRRVGLGQGYGIEMQRSAELLGHYLAERAALAREAETFLAELKKGLLGDAAPAAAPSRRGERLDRLTMWLLTAIGAMLLAGLLTPLACLLGVGFLVLTYLAHPPFPWFPLPPGTEGNPIFINKNVIEALGLCVILTHPTGRWLGLDALWMHWCCRRRSSPRTTA